MRSVCPVCGALATTPAVHAPLVICKSCGLVHDPSIATPGLLTRMEDEWFGEDATLVPRDPANRWLEAVNARRIMRRANAMPGERLLEVGVGSGGTLRYIAKRGVDIEGCDISGPVAKHAQERCGRKVWVCPVVEVPGEFDTVIANHVLEHQPEPVQFLRELAARVRPGGKLVVAVPNVASLDARSKRWISYQPYHLVYFTPDTLEATAAAAGLQVVRRGTYESITTWPLLARKPRREATGLGRERESNRAVLLRTVGMAVGLALSPLRWVIGATGHGDEAYAVLRKP